MLPSFNINAGYDHTGIDEPLVGFFRCIFGWCLFIKQILLSGPIIFSSLCFAVPHILKVEQVLAYFSPITHLFSLFI